jgi:hypothetical protein
MNKRPKCSAYNKKKCWFSPAYKSPLCSSCQKAKNEDSFETRMKGNYIDLLTSKEFDSCRYQGENLDRALRLLYNKHKHFLSCYLKTIENIHIGNHLLLRITTHTNTSLCAVIRWMLQEGLYPESLLPHNCLRCASHLIRGNITNDIYFAIHFPMGGVEHFDMRRLIVKNSKNIKQLAEVAHAIYEISGDTPVLTEYKNLVEKHISQEDHLQFTEELANNPLLHKSILESDSVANKKMLYKRFRARKAPFWEELSAKSMHPSRVFQWCMTEDEKKGFDTPEYIFCSGKAPWHIQWCA